MRRYNNIAKCLVQAGHTDLAKEVLALESVCRNFNVSTEECRTGGLYWTSGKGQKVSVRGVCPVEGKPENGKCEKNKTYCCSNYRS